MKLTWNYDVEKRLATTNITPDLYYTTPDGGQTINKYENGVLVKTFHKYGEENKFSEISPVTGNHITVPEGLDEWPDEVRWLSENYSDVVGTLHQYWDEGFVNEEGQLVDVGKLRGFGVVSPEEKISVNRLLCPASEVEWWDWEVIAEGLDVAEDCMNRGTWWRRHKTTGEIVRTSGGTPPYPCCVHPVVHGPYVVDESDIEKNGGIFVTPRQATK